MANHEASDVWASGDEPAAEAFFSAPPQAVETGTECWDERPMARRERWAMLMTVSTVGVAVLVAVMLGVRSGSTGVGHAGLDGVQLPVPSVGAAEPMGQRIRRAPLVAGPVQPAAESSVADVVDSAALAALAAPAAAPAKRASTPAARARSLTRRAYRAHRSGDHGRAAELASRAIALDPGGADAYVVLGGAHDTRGNRAAAQRTFRQCVAHARGELAASCRTLLR